MLVFLTRTVFSMLPWNGMFIFSTIGIFIFSLSFLYQLFEQPFRPTVSSSLPSTKSVGREANGSNGKQDQSKGRCGIKQAGALVSMAVMVLWICVRWERDIATRAVGGGVKIDDGGYRLDKQRGLCFGALLVIVSM